MNRKVSVEECRACLRKVEDEICHELFQVGDASWASPGAVIATDLAMLAGIEISEYDKHSRLICPECYNRLADAMSFIMTVRRSDGVLKTRFASENAINDKEISTWPKPIPINNSVNNGMDNQIEVQIKQEVLSEDEYQSNCMDQDWEPTMDIKIEPEEFVAPVQPDMFYKSNYSLKGTCEEEKILNGNTNSYEEEFLDSLVKQEPLSSDELEALEALPDLSLDCMLCLKEFQSVTGLKAHVIAQHSYGSVNRNPPTPLPVQKEQTNEFVCATCRKSFETRTDLMVHESCHNKHVCYICDTKFNTFRQLTRHGARCRKRHTPLPRSRPTRPQKLSQSKTNLSNEHKDEMILGLVNDMIPVKDIKVEPTETVVSPLNILNTNDKEPHQQDNVDFIQIFSAPISEPGKTLRILSIDEDDSSQSKEVALQNTKEGISQILLPNTVDNLRNSQGNSGNTTKSITSNEQPITVKQSSNEQEIDEQLAELKQVVIKQEKSLTSEQPMASKQLSNEQQVSKQPIKLKQKVGEETKQKHLSNKNEEKGEIKRKKQSDKQEVDELPMEPKQVSNEQESSNKQEVIEPPMELNKLFNKQDVSEQSMESKQLFNKQKAIEPPTDPKQLSNKQEVIKLPTDLKKLSYRQEASEQTMKKRQLSNEQDVSKQNMKSKQILNEQETSEKIKEPESNEQENIAQFGLKQFSDNQVISGQPKQLSPRLVVIGETFKESLLEQNKCININAQEISVPSPETPLENPFINEVDGNSNASEDNIPNTSDIKINLEIKTR